MTARFLKPLLVVGMLFSGWGIAGLIDQANVPYDGLHSAPDHTINQVREGSPAAAAGLVLGDRLVRINGISVEDTPALVRVPRPAIGETRTLVVEDGASGATREVSITYAQQPPRQRALGWAGFMVGLCFVWLGLLAYSWAPGPASLLLALSGLCLGLTFLHAPYIASPVLRAVVQAISLIVIVIGFATLLHTLAVFPERKAVLERPVMTLVLYAPAVVIATLFAWLTLFEPAGTASLNTFVNAMVGLLIAGYFLLTVVALLHSYVRASSRDRERWGLNLMLAGVLVGLGPVTIAALVGIVAPRAMLPGSDFYSLTLVLVPVTLALAVMRAAPDARRQPAGVPPLVSVRR
jgi:hypothetical protein